MPRKVPLGSRGEVEFPILDAGVLEDCEDEIRRLMAFQSKGDSLPLGKDMAAVVTIAHVALRGVIPDLTRDEVKKSITMKTVVTFASAIAEGFGMEAAPGEAASPSNST